MGVLGRIKMPAPGIDPVQWFTQHISLGGMGGMFLFRFAVLAFVKLLLAVEYTGIITAMKINVGFFKKMIGKDFSPIPHHHGEEGSICRTRSLPSQAPPVQSGGETERRHQQKQNHKKF